MKFPNIEIKKGAGLNDIKYDAALTNFSQAYKNQMGFIADKAFPVVPVGSRTGSYWKWGKDTFLRMKGKKWVPGTPLPTGDFDVDHTPTYECLYRAFSQPMRWDMLDEGDDALDLEQASSEIVTEALLLNREYEFVQSFFKTSVWTTDQTGVSSTNPGANEFTYWSDFEHSDPIDTIKTLKRTVKGRIGIKPNTLILSDEVADTLVDHPLFLERYMAREGVLNLEMIGAVLDIEKIYVGGAVHMTSNEGATEALSEMYGKHAWLGYVNPVPRKQSMSAGYTFAYKAVGRNIGGGYDVAVRRIPDDETMVDKAQGIMCYTQKVVDADAGVFFNGAVK